MNSDHIHNHARVQCGIFFAVKFSEEGEWSVRREPCDYAQILTLPNYYQEKGVMVVLRAMCAAHARGAESARREIRQALGVTE